MESRKKKRRWWLIVCLSPKNGKPRAVLLLRPFFSLLCLFWTLSKKYKKPTRGTEEGDAETTHTEKGKRKKKKKFRRKLRRRNGAPLLFFRPTIARGAIDRFSSATQRAGGKILVQTGPAPMSARLSYTHTAFPYA
jgi:hypothetical protein